MIFVHVETGLEVLIIEHRDEQEVKQLSGEVHKVLISTWLETEAGQPCVHATVCDFHDLQSVSVLTKKGEVTLRRVNG